MPFGLSDPKNTGQYIEIFDMAGLEKLFQRSNLCSGLRPQITRKRVQSVADTIAAYITIYSTTLQKSDESEADTERALHEAWELALMVGNHNRFFASKVGLVQMILARLSCIEEDDVRAVHVTSAATMWALLFRPQSRRKLLSKAPLPSDFRVSIHSGRHANGTKSYQS